MLKPKNLD